MPAKLKKLLERLDPAILDAINNPKKAQKTARIGMLIQQTLYRRLLYWWGCRKTLGSFGESRNLVFGGIGISVKNRGYEEGLSKGSGPRSAGGR